MSLIVLVASSCKFELSFFFVFFLIFTRPTILVLALPWRSAFAWTRNRFMMKKSERPTRFLPTYQRRLRRT